MSTRFDRYSSVVFTMIGVFFVAESGSISASAYGSKVGPNLFPLGLGILLILLSLRLFWEASRKKSEQKATPAVDHRRLISFVVLTFLYAVVMEWMGYVLSTSLFLFCAFWLMNKENWWKSAMIACSFSLLVYYIYVDGLKGTLPGWPAWLN
ncbi:MAG: tripartite tricarboxylate transporter TctB family protein [Brevibacillus sp.]|nr:tripartite tricarboxylate transporter TctB family protein [Brevibacillus sp.]